MPPDETMPGTHSTWPQTQRIVMRNLICLLTILVSACLPGQAPVPPRGRTPSESPTIDGAIDDRPSLIQVWPSQLSPVPRPRRTNGTPSRRGHSTHQSLGVGGRWTATPSTPVARMTRQRQPRLSWRHGENRTTAKRRSRKRRSASAQTGSRDKGGMFEPISLFSNVKGDDWTPPSARLRLL